MKSEWKDELTKTFFRLWHMPESIESVDIFNDELLLKDVYFMDKLWLDQKFKVVKEGPICSKYVKWFEEFGT